MNQPLRIPTLKSVDEFRHALASLGLELPVDDRSAAPVAAQQPGLAANSDRRGECQRSTCSAEIVECVATASPEDDSGCPGQRFASCRVVSKIDGTIRRAVSVSDVHRAIEHQVVGDQNIHAADSAQVQITVDCYAIQRTASGG